MFNVELRGNHHYNYAYYLIRRDSIVMFIIGFLHMTDMNLLEVQVADYDQ